ncbi:MAG: hypothetical protein IPP83_12685 [Flavobacteriales bacterium]|nr:hypothetical protein [Flavobacteriales bacterium]
MQLEYEKKKLYVGCLQHVRGSFRWDPEYNPIRDRRHNVNLLVSYASAKFDAGKAIVRWNYGSGFPFTPTAGFYGCALQRRHQYQLRQQQREPEHHLRQPELSNRLPDYARVI